MTKKSTEEKTTKKTTRKTTKKESIATPAVESIAEVAEVTESEPVTEFEPVDVGIISKEYIVNTESARLNVRTGPSTTEEVILTLEKGSVVKATGKISDGWAEVIIGENKGWCMLKFLR